jgi:hypothetical protein
MNKEFPEEEEFPEVPQKSNFLNEYKRLTARQRMELEPDGYKIGQLHLHTVDTTRPKTIRDYHIPFGSGRPERTTVINDEDIMNLIIDLETGKI